MANRRGKSGNVSKAMSDIFGEPTNTPQADAGSRKPTANECTDKPKPKQIIAPTESVTKKPKRETSTRKGRGVESSDGVVSTTYSIQEILHKTSTDTRGLNPTKVLALLQSISAIGLISGITVDAASFVLAGRHRRAACFVLAAPKGKRSIVWLELFGLEPNENIRQAIEDLPDKGWEYFDPSAIPVRIYPFDSEKEPDLARRIQISENELRHSYTEKELRSIVVSLLSAGYKFNPGGGRMKADEKSLTKEIELIFGLSQRSVMRLVRKIMEEDGVLEKKPEPVPPPVKKTYRAIERSLNAEEFQREALEGARKKLESVLEELKKLYPEIINPQKRNTK